MTGTPILQTQFGTSLLLEVTLAFGADLTAASNTWTFTDVTADALQVDGTQRVNITIGQQDERSDASPATCDFLLDNTGNKYSAHNPLCSNWPNVVMGTPVRIRISNDSGATWHSQFEGNAHGFPPSVDGTGKKQFVKITASGTFRRLNQGDNNASQVPLMRTITTSSPIAYWTLYTDFNSALTGGAALVPNGPTNWTFNTTGSAGSSGSVTRASNTASFSGPVTMSGSSSFRIDFMYQKSTTDTTDSGLILTFVNGSSTTFNISSGATAGVWQHNRLEIYSSGGAALYDYYIDNVQTASAVSLGFSYVDLAQIQMVVTVAGFVNADSFSDLAVWTPRTITANVYGASKAFVGEDPNTRLSRICGEEGIPYLTVGTYTTSRTMGAQGTDDTSTILREAREADFGSLYDGLSFGLNYQGISQRYGQAITMILNAATSQFMVGGGGSGWEPPDDDFLVRNYITATLKNGGNSIIAQDTTSDFRVARIGKYPDSYTVNLQDATHLTDVAQWPLRAAQLYAQAFRYTPIELDFAARPTLVASWITMLPGSRIQLTNLSSWYAGHPPGPVDLCVIGWSQSIGQRTWNATLNCILNDPYNVFTVADSSVGRIDAGAATMASTATAGASSLSVASGDGTLFTTTATFPADFPFYVNIDGIQVKVTAITGTSSPQTFTVDATTVTKTLSSGKAVKLWKPGAIRY